ncbi:hypothetical protein CUJ90_25335 [Paraburkholderia terricola]|nr:hypothetical protein CUJ90_25335 [Paraburkholderia terricola]
MARSSAATVDAGAGGKIKAMSKSANRRRGAEVQAALFKAPEVVFSTLKSLIATLHTLSVTEGVRRCALCASLDGNRSETFIVT